MDGKGLALFLKLFLFFSSQNGKICEIMHKHHNLRFALQSHKRTFPHVVGFSSNLVYILLFIFGYMLFLQSVVRLKTIFNQEYERGE